MKYRASSSKSETIRNKSVLALFYLHHLSLELFSSLQTATIICEKMYKKGCENCAKIALLSELLLTAYAVTAAKYIITK